MPPRRGSLWWWNWAMPRRAAAGADAAMHALDLPLVLVDPRRRLRAGTRRPGARLRARPRRTGRRSLRRMRRRPAPGRSGHRPVRRRQVLGAAGAGRSRLRGGRQSAAAHARGHGDAQRAQAGDRRRRAHPRLRRRTSCCETLDRLRANPALRPELVFAWADETTLLRRYTETRRRHPLAPQGRVTDGIAREETADRATARAEPTW